MSYADSGGTGESLLLQMIDMDVEPEVAEMVEMEADSANDGEMVGMELEKECEDDSQELVLTKGKLLLYREEDGDQELELTTKDLELTTIELEEEQTGTTDKSETIENQLIHTTLTSAEYENDDFGCYTMNWN